MAWHRANSLSGPRSRLHDIMTRSPVGSSSIVSVGYDDDSRILEIEYSAGNVYQYMDVPREVYEWFLRAQSKGGFVTRMIKERYAYREILSHPVDGDSDLLAALHASVRMIGSAQSGRPPDDSGRGKA